MYMGYVNVNLGTSQRIVMQSGRKQDLARWMEYHSIHPV